MKKIKRFFRQVRAFCWCVRDDWQYPEWRSLHHMIWTWKMLRNNWRDVPTWVAVDWDEEDDWDNSDGASYDPYYDEG
jgi:hypothetical protein